ncbi:DUF637 domain-containing protein [Rhodoferax aquaticus]|nr:DUF637 domain-containing protein [Rhodoferax aquaticus]
MEYAQTAPKTIAIRRSCGAYSYSQTGIDWVAGLYVQGPGVLYASAGNNINLTAAEVAGNGAVQLDAGNNVNLQTLTTRQTNTFNAGDAKNHLLTSQTSDVGSTITAGTNLTVNAGNSITARAATLNAADTVALAAKGNIILDAGQTQSSYDSVQTSTSSSLLSSTTTSTQTQASSATAQVSTINAKNISVIADQNLVSVGTVFKGSNSVYVEGKDTTTLYAATNTTQSTTTTQSSSSLLGLTLEDKTTTDSKATASSIGSRLISNEKVTIGVGNRTELQGTDIQSPETSFVKTDPRKRGELVIGASKDTTQTSHTEKSETAGVWQEQKGQGTTTQTLNQTKISGNVSFDNALKITVQIPDTKGGQELKSQIQALAGQSTGAGTSTGLEYLNTLAQRTDIQWDKVALAHENWSYQSAGLTPAGAALLTIAVAAGTGGLGAGLTGTTGALGTAMSAGFSSLASQAAVSLVNNGGDIGKTLEQLGKEESIKGLLLTMATAGALDKLNSTMGWNNINAKSPFVDQLQKNLTNNVATDLMNSALAGKPFDEKTFANSLKGALINTGMAQGANAIGDAASSQNGNPPLIDAFTHKLAHAILGCVGGSASAGDTKGCAPGAVGGVVGELAAQYYNPSGDPTKTTDTVNFAKTMAAVAGLLVGGGGDNAQAVNIAATTGANAAQNNRQLHPDQYKLAKEYSKNKSVRDALSKIEGREVSETELEGRLTAEMLRNSDASASAQSGGVNDYKLRSLMGCQLLNCDASKTDPDYANSRVNSQFLASNWSTYANGLSQLKTGQTYNQLVTNNVKDNPVSTGVAGAGMIGYGVVIGGPATIGTRLITGGVGAGGNAGFQSIGDQPMDWVDVGIAGFTGFVTGGGGFWQGLTSSVAINSGGALAGSAIKSENPNAAMGGAAAGTVLGYGAGKAIESVVKIKVDPWYRPEWISAGPYGIVQFNTPSQLPFLSGTLGSTAAQEPSGDSIKGQINKAQGQ